MKEGARQSWRDQSVQVVLNETTIAIAFLVAMYAI